LTPKIVVGVKTRAESRKRVNPRDIGGMTPCGRGVAKTFIALLVVAVVIIGFVALVVLFNMPNANHLTGTSTSSNQTCTHMTVSSYSDYCSAPLSYTQLQDFVNRSTVPPEYREGAIVLHVGYHPCTIWFYTLPNATDVVVYLGTDKAAQTCE